MTIKKCATTEECDNRYLLQKAFWLMVAMGALGLVAGSFAGGQKLQNIETRISTVEKNQNDIKDVKDKLDTLLARTVNK